MLTDTIADMAQDTSIHDFIKQNALILLTDPVFYRVSFSKHVSHYAFSSSPNPSHSADPWLCLRFTPRAHFGHLQARMTVEKISISSIGFFSLVGRAYVFKFLWSPVMDRYTPPFWAVVVAG